MAKACPNQCADSFPLSFEVFCRDCGSRLIGRPDVVCQHCAALLFGKPRFCAKCGRATGLALVTREGVKVDA